MCGIFGYGGAPPDRALLARMAASLRHRGPNHEGALATPHAGIGMCRLSIIDVAGGNQPILNEDESLAIVFNGEIYNHEALRRQLQHRGHRFRTSSDTEVILHLYEEQGKDCVHQLEGMFAFAVLDQRSGALFLARDRLGIKPLYYWCGNGKFVFGSEIKAILESPAVSAEPDLRAVDAYLTYRYVPGPSTVFRGVFKLPAAHTLCFHRGEIELEPYWSWPAAIVQDRPDGWYQERFDALFAQSVSDRLMSEVPLGAYLSGGVDSTAIVANMARMIERPVKTFSVGFGWGGDELAHAADAARRLGAEHREILCTDRDFEQLPQLLWHLDEPVGDAIVLPMYLLSKLASEEVKVVLSGEGADETLGGYFMHKVLGWTRTLHRWVPDALERALLRPTLTHAPLGLVNRAFDYPAGLGERGRRRLVDYLAAAREGGPRRQYHYLIGLLDPGDKAAAYAGALAQAAALPSGPALPEPAHELESILALQFEHWLPDDILTKFDKLTMAHSVEGRVPFLDHRLVEFLAGVPPHLKLSRRGNKLVLRRHLERIFAGGASRRRKAAFYVPLDLFLTSAPLREMIDACLSDGAVRRRGWFAPEWIRHIREQAVRGEFLCGKQLLAILLLELWQRIFIDRERGWVGEVAPAADAWHVS